MLGTGLAHRKAMSVNLLPDNAWQRQPRLISRLFGSTSTASGVRVAPSMATRAGAVYGAVTLTADTMSAMPVRFIEESAGGAIKDVRPPELQAFWSPRVNPLQTRIDFVQTLYISLLVAGEAFIYPRRTNGGDIFEAWILDPDRVEEVQRMDGEDGSVGLRFKVDGWDENQGWIENRPKQPVRLAHITLHQKPGSIRGMSPIAEAAELVGMSLSAQEHAARFLGDGVHMTGAIVTPAELDRDEAKELVDNFNLVHAGPKKTGGIGVLTGGSDFKTFTIPPAELQFLEQMKYANAQISEVIYRCPPHLSGDVEKATSWGTGIEEQTNNWVKFRLLNLARKVEAVFEADFVTPGSNVGMRFVMNGLLRGVAKDRAEFYRTLWNLGVFSQDDILGFEDMPPLPDGLGTGRYIPLNMVKLGDAESGAGLGANAATLARARAFLDLFAEGR